MLILSFDSGCEKPKPESKAADKSDRPTLHNPAASFTIIKATNDDRPQHPPVTQTNTMLSRLGILIAAGATTLGSATVALDKSMDFGPNNPFYAPSTLPFHAPPFDKIKDSDYQPAIDAGMAQQREEMKAIADNSAPPTFENTIVAMEKTGRLFDRALSAFGAVTGADLNPVLEHVQKVEAPKLAAHSDAIFLDAKLFQRVKAIYDQRNSLKLDAESTRLVDWYYKK